MRFYKYILAGLGVALTSTLYNFFIFEYFDFYPDAYLVFPFFELETVTNFWFYAFFFMRGFFIGIALMFFFAHGMQALESQGTRAIDDANVVFFFAAYGIISLVTFTLGDIIFMRSPEGLLLLLTVDSLIETFVALLPIRIFYFHWFKAGKKA